ncbi:MAG: GGDEF domain-containing protein [Alphaproteobacteria bacterium]|nr:GGDEF domain-containing protein [Alphaproteobacteria bacterium]
MKIGSDPPRRPGGPQRPAEGPAPPQAGGAAAPVGAPAPVRAIADTTEIFGIPEAELTPKVRTAIGQLMAEVDHLKRELGRMQARLAEVENLADQDVMLPILNRRAFVRELSRVLSFAERYRVQASLIYFDLDGFKAVNDTFGHAAGDAALAAIANLLVSNVRGSDVVGRLGGDEFGVILASATLDQARAKADSLAALIAETPLSWKGETFRLDASTGVYSFDQAEDAADILDRADRAMYERKRRR